MSIRNVLKAGLIAGFIICLSAVTMVPIVGDEMTKALANLNLPPLNTSAMFYFFIVSLSLGTVLIWIYAALLPGLKNQVKSLIIAVFIVWFLSCFLANLSIFVYGFLPLKLIIVAILWGFVELLVAGIIARRFYKE